MRLLIACTVVAGATGCELLYNPSNLHGKQFLDATRPIDADPSMPSIDDVFPSVVFEGAGSGGSRPAVVVIHGRNLVSDAVVTFTPNTNVKVTSTTSSGDANIIAVTLEIDVDPNLHEGMTPLSVSLVQNGGTASADDSQAAHHVALQGLEEFGNTRTQTVGVYSQVVAASSSFTLDTHRFVLRAIANIAITGAIAVDANKQAPGAGGGAGRAARRAGASTSADGVACAGAGNAPMAGVLTGAGGGGAG